ncbi:MAG: ADP-ribosyltransferase [Thermomicrobiales bacterium]
MPEPEYRIVATPSLRIVTKGAKVTYRVERTTGCSPGQKEHFDWGLLYDPNNRTFFDSKERRGPCGASEWTFKWDDDGCHAITCRVRSSFNTPPRLVVEYQQIVCQLKHAYELLPPLALSAEDPEAVLHASSRTLELARMLEKESKITQEAMERHKKQMSVQTAFCQRLKSRLQPTHNRRRYPVYAEHLDMRSQRRTPIRLFLSELEAGRKWCLVDWTDPTVQMLTGDYPAEGANSAEAIKQAFANWNNGNRYPEGQIRYRAEVPGVGSFAGEFESDGKSTSDEVATLFERIALGATIVAGVVTLLAPVPGSQVISALLWANVFAGTTAAVINLAERHAEGFGSAAADAVDVITIVGNMLGGTALVARAWQQGATLSVRAATTVLRGALIGQVTTDTIQGVVVGMKSVEELTKIRADENLTPSEKIEQMAKVLAVATATGALYYINLKGTAKDLAALRTAPASEVEAFTKKISELSDPRAEVDISSSAPSGGTSGQQSRAVTSSPGADAQPGSSSSSTSSSQPAVATSHSADVDAPATSSPQSTPATMQPAAEAPSSSQPPSSASPPHGPLSSASPHSAASPHPSGDLGPSTPPHSSSSSPADQSPVPSSSTTDLPMAASSSPATEATSPSAAAQSSSPSQQAAHDAPEVKGHTDQKKHTTVVQTEADTDAPHVGPRATPKVLTTITERFKAAVGEVHFEKLMAEVPNLRAKLKDAVKHLSDDELAAVHGYTTDWKKLEFGNKKDYQRINTALRLHDADEIAFLQDYIDLLKSGLAKLPAYEGDVFRTMAVADYDKFKTQFVVGEVWRDHGFMSTSHTRPEQITDKAPNIMMTLAKTKSGHIVEGVSAYDTEREVLFMPNTPFRVLSLSEKDGILTLIVKEVTND